MPSFLLRNLCEHGRTDRIHSRESNGETLARKLPPLLSPGHPQRELPRGLTGRERLPQLGRDRTLVNRLTDFFHPPEEPAQVLLLLNRKPKPGLAQRFGGRLEAGGRPAESGVGLKFRERYAAQAIPHTLDRAEPAGGQGANPGRQDDEWAPIRHGLL